MVETNDGKSIEKSLLYSGFEDICECGKSEKNIQVCKFLIYETEFLKIHLQNFHLLFQIKNSYVVSNHQKSTNQ